MDQTFDLPHGFRFNPFEEELINFYLKPKVLGQEISSNVVQERQIYGPNANPWEIFDPENHSWILSEVTPGKFEKVTYVFVNLTKKAAVERKKKGGRDNYIKKAGCGTWDGQTKRMEIRDGNGNLIGEKRFLVFEINDDSYQDLIGKVGYWKMHEYHLCGVNEDVVNSNNTVLCKITLDHSKNPPMKLRLRTKPQKKNTNVDSVCSPSITDNQTHCDDAVVFDSYKDKRKQGCDIVGISDDVECIDNSAIEENKKLKPASSVFSCNSKHDDDNPKIDKQEGARGDLISNFIQFL